MLWTFTYKEGPAPQQGCVEASSEARAFEVMRLWGERRGVKVFGSVKPMILADESILPASVKEPEILYSGKK